MKEATVEDREKHLEKLTKEVAALRVAMENAQAQVNAAEAGVAEANRILPTNPNEANRKAVKAANAKLEKAREVCAAAEKAFREASAEEEMQSAAHLRAKQSAFARQILVEKKAARNPEIMELLEESKAKGLALDSMREKLGQTEKDLAAANERIAELESQLAQARKDLAAALK